MPKNIAIAGDSDVGLLRRRNEDSFAVSAELGIAVVADGMGGHPGGDVASRLAAENAARVLSEAATDSGAGGEEEGADHFVERFRSVMGDAVMEAHRAIRSKGEVQPELDGMGTTLTAMIVDRASGAWVIGHVGDSRVYRLREGSLEQLTRDDTWVQDQVDRGAMQPENARHSPYAHLLTQCVGLADPPAPQLLHGVGEAGEVYLLCTDGLVGMLDDGRVASILANGTDPSSSPEQPLQALIEAANEAGGHDNITAALVKLE
ncbi:MAG: protein phosphatase 2C domain-containing protein [Longimicrobiales bacterium]|nr:protein phosphatase 2C domain-containing protein [Longimicrobiales bacterium]